MPEKILIVDDSSAIRQSVGFILRENGYDVIEACDGQDALEKQEGQQIDLVITDVNMPRMDGITLIKKLREVPSTKYVPILVLTTESQSSTMEDGKKAGATGWIVKPFSNDKLLATVKKVI